MYTFICTVSNDGPGFSWSCLAISKERAIETFPSIVEDSGPDISENFFLEKKNQFELRNTAKPGPNIINC